MKSTIKKSFAFMLALLLMQTTFRIFVPVQAKAENTEAEIMAKIEAMARGDYGKEFKAGNYWNKSITSACPAGTNYSHASTDNDKKYTVYTNGNRRSGTQCFGFAFAVFDELFGGGDGNNIACTQITYSGSGSKKAWLQNNAHVGDLIYIDGHYGIFYKYDSNYLYLYDANGYKNGGTCRISLTEKRPWDDKKLKDGTEGYILHASSYLVTEDTTPANDCYRLTSPDGVQTVRSQPSTSSSAVGELKSGDYVTVTKYTYDKSWGYVSHNELSGWIRLYYVELHDTHSYGAWSTTKAATCTEEGTKQRLCACGKKETSQFAALGHDYSDTWTVEKKQTCTEDGLKYRLCTRCSSKADITTLSATGHNYSQWKTILEATCTTDGRMERSCTCGSIEYQAVASTGHNWSNWIQTTAATTQTDGEEIRSCNLCMQVQTRSIPKLSADGHTHIFSESGWIEILPATCMEDGKKERYCQLCYGPETQIIPALSHSFTPWQTQTEATTEQDGLSVRECVLCGAEEMLTIPKLNAPDPTPSASTTPGTTNANEPASPTESIADDAPILPTDSINTTDVPTEDNFDKVDVLIIIATVSLLFGVGATTALVVVTVKKRR